ncbi:MAG: HAMP domain-containing protein [Blastocatellia bacterium]|nr:HAMP domain-containing protein [Blastocatellia bacterium]
MQAGGAVIAQIDGESVRELFSDIELAEKSIVAIFNKDGRILYRRSSEDISFSSEIIGNSLIESLGKEKIKVAEIESPFDKVTRVYGLARTEKTGNIIVVGIPSSRFYETLWQQIYRQIGITLLILLVALGITLTLAYGILKSLNNLKDATDKFADGNRDTKAPENLSGEIGELGKAFNRMAEQINHREDRLKELDNLKSEFVSSVSHELKTPLTTIKTLVHVLKNNKVNQQEKNEYLEVIGSECDRQILLVSNILDVSQIEAGKNKYQSGKIELNEILKEVCQIEKSNAALKNINLLLEIKNEIPYLKANAEALVRVFRSLLENAVKYSPENEKVIVSTEILENEIAVSISDHGCGIDTADLPYIFDKFYRGRPQLNGNETAQEVKGTGLGLYITKKLSSS